MPAVNLAPAVRRWECPNCDHTDVTREAKPYTRCLPCRGLKGLTAPMVPADVAMSLYWWEEDV